MFTKTLAMELAEARVNVNCIAPGYIQLDSAAPDSEFRRAHFGPCHEEETCEAMRARTIKFVR